MTDDRTLLPDRDRVPVLTVVPMDPEQMPIGGIASFIRGFVKFAPADFNSGSSASPARANGGGGAPSSLRVVRCSCCP